VGFLRGPDGTITVFHVPGAGTGPGQGTIGFCDNDFDAITGYYIGGAIYLNAQAGTPRRSGLVSKYDLSFQQFIGEFFGSYRLIEEPRGWLDLLGGRFTISATRWVCKPTTWQSMRRVPSWWTNSLNS
jgi:hypothetical protein